MNQPSQNVLAPDDFASYNEISAAYFILNFINNIHKVSSSSIGTKNIYEHLLWIKLHKNCPCMLSSGGYWGPGTPWTLCGKMGRVNSQWPMVLQLQARWRPNELVWTMPLLIQKFLDFFVFYQVCRLKNLQFSLLHLYNVLLKVFEVFD